MTCGPLNGQITSFTYDCRNRLISAGATIYTYDAENQRIAVETRSKKTEYCVDSASNSLSRILFATEYARPNGRWTQTKKNPFVYGDGLLAQEYSAGEYLTYHYNNVGSTTALTDETGNVVKQI